MVDGGQCVTSGPIDVQIAAGCHVVVAQAVGTHA